MAKAYANRWGGVCEHTGVNVPKGEGWVVANGAGWLLLSDAAMRKAGHTPVVAAERRLPGRGAKGVTTGLSVADAWVKAFKDNEERARAYQSNDTQPKPWTDEQIRRWMLAEFPGSPEDSRSLERVRMYRSCYNASSHSFSGRPVPETRSRAYSDDGSAGEAPEPRRRDGVDEARVRQIAKEEAGAVEARVMAKVDAERERPVVHVAIGGKKPKKIDSLGKHVRFVDVLKRVEAGVPIMLVGPAGCGKTHLAAQVADALGLDFTFNSMSEGVSESHLLGRMLPDAKGAWSYQPAPFVRSYGEGGVHLLDEVDAADPNLLVTINAALANGQLSLPFAQSKPVKRHADSVIIAAANTFGTGADRQYVGRNQLDAATVDRFRMGTVVMDYDREVERAIVDAVLGTGKAAGDELLAWAWGVRRGIETAKLRRIMSTRAIGDSARLLSVGLAMSDVKAAYFSGWTQDEKAKVPQ